VKQTSCQLPKVQVNIPDMFTNNTSAIYIPKKLLI